MKCLFILSVLAFLLSCRPKQEPKVDRYYNIFRTRNYADSTYSSLARYIERYHPDSSKKKEARDWLKEQQQKKEDQIIFNQAFELIDVFKSTEECNYIRKHYLAIKLTNNEDTLKMATVILVHSVYDQIRENCKLNKGKNAGVFLYETENDFKMQRSFSMATTVENVSTEVGVGKQSNSAARSSIWQ